MATPTDPLYPSQWHFGLIGDIETIWDDYNGNGVNVAVVDSGVDYNHADLDGNYDSSLHVVDNFGNPVDPFPNAGGAHGTACAGLIGAEANNGEGGTGVASGVTMAGIQIFESGVYGFVNASNTDAFMDVVGQQYMGFDISSNSWGSTPSYAVNQNLNSATGTSTQSGFAADLEVQYGMLSELGRNGLGTVILQAAGNDNRNANGSGTNAQRFTITVAATDENGDATWYTNFGSSILLAAPAAAVTTDITGAPGYGPGDYTNTFGGTSAATPVTAGVVALMLEAAEALGNDLGWRDIQNILAHSAALTGTAYGGPGAGEEDGSWFSTGGENFNGGGHTFHANYGFGMLDAFAAVRMAEIWTHMTGGPAVSAGSAYTPSAPGVDNEQSSINDSGTINLAFGDGNVGIGVAATDTQTVTDDIHIDNIQVRLDFDFSYNGSVLQIFLIAPDGTRFELVNQENYLSTAAGIEWTWGVTTAIDMSSMGDWTIEIVDTDGFGDLGTLVDWQIEFYGSAGTTDDIHTITDDYNTLAAVDGDRAVIDDTNGGIDWLNLVAIQGAVMADLALGTFMVNAVAWGSLGLNDFENVAAGDGNDTIRGTTGANEILGMRGNDEIHGRGGNDTLIGGDGNDDIRGGTGRDILEGNEGGDTLRAQGGDDGLFGHNGADLLVGGTGDDTIEGGRGNDTMTGQGNDDTMRGNAGDDDMTGGSGRDTMRGDGDNDTLRGQSGEDSLLGGSGEDSLIGGGNSDILRGQGGNDTLLGQQGQDLLVGGSGQDSMHGGSGNDTLIGQSGSDTLNGFSGVDDLRGGGNNDVFEFSHHTHSGTTVGTRDIIRQWHLGNNVIDVSQIDADIGTGADDAFTFIGTAAHSATAGTLRYVVNGAGNTLVSLDVDGGGSDMMIEILGTHVLTAADFIL